MRQQADESASLFIKTLVIRPLWERQETQQFVDNVTLEGQSATYLLG